MIKEIEWAEKLGFIRVELRAITSGFSDDELKDVMIVEKDQRKSIHQGGKSKKLRDDQRFCKKKKLQEARIERR